jgi:hypothetical protein
MMIIYNLIPNNSLIELLLNFYSKNIVANLPVLILCGVVTTISYILFSSHLGKNIIKKCCKNRYRYSTGCYWIRIYFKFN